METLKYKIIKTATVRTFGNPQTATKILFALHGYGQLGQYFLRKFSTLSNDFYIVVPEGLHRFYLQGSDGRVGASWMTKENREEDIADYIGYLDQVWTDIENKFEFKEKILLGFSQGGATAARWHERGQFKSDVFILWGAIFPPDLNQNFNSKFQPTKNYFVVGNNDPYYSQEKINAQIKYFAEKNVNFTVVEFDGQHEIKTETLERICN